MRCKLENTGIFGEDAHLMIGTAATVFFCVNKASRMKSNMMERSWNSYITKLSSYLWTWQRLDPSFRAVDTMSKTSSTLLYPLILSTQPFQEFFLNYVIINEQIDDLMWRRVWAYLIGCNLAVYGNIFLFLRISTSDMLLFFFHIEIFKYSIPSFDINEHP